MDDDSREMADEMTTPTAMDAPTDALPAPTTRPSQSLVAGVLVAVLVLLGIGMVVAQVVGAAQHHPGPGARGRCGGGDLVLPTRRPAIGSRPVVRVRRVAGGHRGAALDFLVVAGLRPTGNSRT
jgi:hypothetical protein